MAEPFLTLSDLPPKVQELTKKALEVRHLAYAPYSQFKVGCAVLDERGNLFTGCNVENASYGAVICAERVALTKMISEGGNKWKQLVVVTSSSELLFPCGECLQVMAEFNDMGTVYAVDETASRCRKESFVNLFPYAVKREHVEVEERT